MATCSIPRTGGGRQLAFAPASPRCWRTPWPRRAAGLGSAGRPPRAPCFSEKKRWSSAKSVEKPCSSVAKLAETQPALMMLPGMGGLKIKMNFFPILKKKRRQKEKPGWGVLGGFCCSKPKQRGRREEMLWRTGFVSKTPGRVGGSGSPALRGTRPAQRSLPSPRSSPQPKGSNPALPATPEQGEKSSGYQRGLAGLTKVPEWNTCQIPFSNQSSIPNFPRLFHLLHVWLLHFQLFSKTRFLSRNRGHRGKFKANARKIHRVFSPPPAQPRAPADRCGRMPPLPAPSRSGSREHPSLATFYKDQGGDINPPTRGRKAEELSWNTLSRNCRVSSTFPPKQLVPADARERLFGPAAFLPSSARESLKQSTPLEHRRSRAVHSSLK